MSKTTKPRNDWDAIHSDYIIMGLTETSKKYDICHTQIARKAKKEGWLNEKKLVEAHEELSTEAVKIIKEHIEDYPKVQELQKKIHDCVLHHKIDEVDKNIASMALYKAQLMNVQNKFAKIIEKSASQVEQILDMHKDGLYTSSIKGDGSATYDRTTRFISDLAPFFAENNKALGLTTAQIAIQNNVGGNSGADDVVISTNVVDASRDYQDFIKSNK